MGNLSVNGMINMFYVYRDKYGNVKSTQSAATAESYSANGKFATVILPVAEDFSNFEDSKMMEAFGELECLK